MGGNMYDSVFSKDETKADGVNTGADKAPETVSAMIRTNPDKEPELVVAPVVQPATESPATPV